MSESINDFLAECEKAANDNPKKACLPEFLAHKEMIAIALSRGWRVATVWKVLHDKGKYTGRYASFAALVRKHLRQDGK